MIRQTNYPFRSWVPRPLGIITIIFMYFPVFFVSGTYASSMNEIASGLGIITEHIQYANFTTFIGMVLFTPFAVKLLTAHRPKLIYLGGFILLFLLSYVCARTESMPLLMICSLVMGFIRMMLVFNSQYLLVKYIARKDLLYLLSPSTDDVDIVDEVDHFKSTILPVLYLFIFTLMQISSSLTAWLAYEYEWQYIYYFIMGMMMVAIFLVEITMQYQPWKLKHFINLKKTGDVLLAAIVLMSSCYVFVYGKTLDWFDDHSICLASALFFLSLGLFIIIECNSKLPYLQLKAFTQKNMLIAGLLFLLMMSLSSSSLLMNLFIGISMKTDNVQTTLMNNYSIIGYLIGVILSVVMAKKRVHFKIIFSFGFLCILTSLIYMYFQYQVLGLYENLIFPIIIRSVGMFIVCAMGAVYGMKRMPRALIGSWLFIMLVCRLVIAPAVGNSVYGAVMNDRQQYYINSFSREGDILSADIASKYAGLQMGKRLQGGSNEESQSAAVTTLKIQTQFQAALSALKEVTGWSIFSGIIFLGIALAINYDKRGMPARP